MRGTVRCNAVPAILRGWLVTAVAVVFTSCGSPPSPLAVYATTGQVFVDGQPAAGARIAFHPRSGGEALENWPSGYPRAVADQEGNFVVGTYGDRDGCPAGEYVLLVTWPAAPGADGEHDGETVDRLQGRYGSTENSTLSASVPNGPTTLPRYDLKSSD